MAKQSKTTTLAATQDDAYGGFSFLVEVKEVKSLKTASLDKLNSKLSPDSGVARSPEFVPVVDAGAATA